MKPVLFVFGFLAMVGILTGCPSTTQPTTPTLSAHLLWQDDNGLDVSQEVRNFELIDAPDGALIQFKDGVYKSSSTKYVLKGWPEVITQDSQVIQGDDGKSKMAPPEVIVAAHLIGALIYFHGYNCPTAVIEPNEFQVYLPMGPTVVTAELEVTTDSGQFVLLFHGPAYGDTDPVDDTSYDLTTSVQGSGTITPTNGSYPAGTVVSVTATPSSGWTFSHWLVNNVQGSTDPSAQITMDSDVNLIAVFKQNVTPNPDPTDTTGKVIIDLTTNSDGTVGYNATAPDGYAYAVFGGVGTEAQIQSLGLQLYYTAAVNGLWTDRQTFAFSGWPCTGKLTKVSGRTLRFEVVANASGGWGDPQKLIVRLDGKLVPRVADESGNVAYQVTLP